MNEIVDVICGDAKKNCAIKLDGVYCDGYHEHGQIGVFSHFHDDHVKSLHQCVLKYDTLIAHHITCEGIDALLPGFKYRQQWVPQGYDTAYDFGAGKIRLLKANHIPGSSQVHVESSNGDTMLYSGDFSYPDIQIRQADYLVIDSTHGDPWHDGKTDRRTVKNRMFEHVEEQLKSHRHIVIMVSSGTLQEIVRHFEIGYGKKMRDDIAFAMDKKQGAVLHNIYADEKKEFREIVEYNSHEFWDMLRTDKRCIIFTTQLDVEILDSELDEMHKIIVDTYRFSKENDTPIIPFDGGCRFNLAAHTSINGIYEYVESVKPKYVVTDNSRSRYAKQLAKLLEQRIPRIKTEYRPSYD